MSRPFLDKALALAFDEMELDPYPTTCRTIPFEKVKHLYQRNVIEWICCHRGDFNSVQYHKVLLIRKIYRNGTTRDCLDLWIGQCKGCGVVTHTHRSYTWSLYRLSEG